MVYEELKGMAGSPRLSGLRSSFGLGNEVTSLEVSAMGAASKLAAVLATYPQQVLPDLDACACIQSCASSLGRLPEREACALLLPFIAASCQALAPEVPYPSANVLMMMQLDISIELTDVLIADLNNKGFQPFAKEWQLSSECVRAKVETPGYVYLQSVVAVARLSDRTL